MRLTLRTLLAYLDEILEPSDAEELAKKIRESDFASGLVHRIRSSMGRLRLSAPKMIGKGMGTDPNSVAEYLDNTMPVERVPEFEKVCLESDMHLAEVASCHQILTLVLGEAAQVVPALRNRVYGLGTESRAWKGQDAFQSRVDEAIASTTSGNGAGAGVVRPDTEGVDRRAAKANSPRRTKRHLWALGLTLLLAFLLTTSWLVLSGMLRTAGPEMAENPSAPTVDLPPTVGDAPPPAQVPLADDAAFAPDIVPDTTAMPDRSSAFLETTPAPVSPAGIEAAGTVDEAPLKPEDPGDDTSGLVIETPSLEPAGSPAGETSVRAPTPEPASDMTDLPPDIVPLTVLEGTPEPPPLEVLDRPSPREGRSGGNFFAAAADPGPEVARRSPAAAHTAAADSKATTEAPVAADVGRNILEDQVLAYFDAATELWLRLPGQAALLVGQRLRVPSGFRPQVLLSNGMKVTLNGRTDLSFIPSPDARLPKVRIDGGQALLMGMGQEPGSIRLQCDQRELHVTLSDANAHFAIDVRRFANPGTDPREAPRHLLTQLWVISGQVAVREGDGDRDVQTVGAGQRWSAVDLRKSVIDEIADVPPWLEGSGLSDIDRTGIREIEPKLVPDRSLTLSLSELAGHRRARTDVRSLSARCLASFDRYEPLVEALGDARLHSSWTAIFEELRAAVARDAHSAQLVEGELLRTQGPDAEKMFRLLWGFTPAQLRAGGATDLIDDLEHEAMQVRVLAIENLKEITGGMSLLFRPDRPPSNRRISVQTWRKRLEAGQIVYRQPPLVVEPDAF